VEKSLIIIGGGLTGLAAGCYGRMNGYRTSIFEMHNIAGGVCTGWKSDATTIGSHKYTDMRRPLTKVQIVCIGLNRSLEDSLY
jgi:monoamine oxidase